MRGNILCCVLVLALGSHAADLIHEAVNETQHVYLPCPPPVEDKVTWSVERNGAKIDIITYDGDKTEKHIKGNSKIYTVIADQYKSLYIQKAELSDSGKYFCNNKSVNLTVIPSGTKTQTVKEGRNTTLKCSSNVEGSYKTTWRREVAGKSEPIRFPVPVVGKKVILTNVHLSDFGLYFCDGKPAVYLNVTKNMKNPGEGER
ncbi:uncharacterized protein LOC112450043 [Kryptolebias marmoratus]|uniref:uncharacterized protein LOC112450043 n=1 Tax=Kryptolebias marmoratus TaxID=37003 RepID=UPI000D530DF8|nr:uncharacterized protein LOC112450043 [Kryptolebias marmoratus]